MTTIEKQKSLINLAKNIIAKHDTIAKSTGEKFNIFSVINLHEKELQHSRFIAELLNPEGRHSQGNIFLQLFITTIQEDEFLKNNGFQFEFNIENTKVYIEYWTGVIRENKTKGGSIDILVKNKHDETFLIENKVNAEEQANQLLRYHNAFPQKKGLFYLTLDRSFSKTAIDQENNPIEYQPISYRTTIIKWLDKCIEEVGKRKIPKLQEALQQYKDTIEKLTNKSNRMREEIINEIQKNSKNILAYRELIRGKNDFVKKMINELIIPRIIEISNKKGFDLYIQNSKESKSLYKAKNGTGFDLKHEDMKDLYIRFQFHEKNVNGLMFGLKSNGKTINEKRIEIIKQNAKENNLQLHNTKNFIFKVKEEEYANWGNLETLSKIIQEGGISEDFVNHFEMIIDNLKEIATE